MHDVSGVSGAGPIWHDIMAWLHSDASSAQPARPPEVNQATVSFAQHIEPAREEFFIGDTTLTHVNLADASVLHGYGRARILEPAANTIIALDPDIPRDKQSIRLRAGSFTADLPDNVSWRIGDRVLVGAQAAWRPLPGRHRIQLLNGQGEVQDEVRIEVRVSGFR